MSSKIIKVKKKTRTNGGKKTSENSVILKRGCWCIFCVLNFCVLACIELIEKPTTTGLLTMLDEECRMPGGSDKTFLDKLKTKFKVRREIGTTLFFNEFGLTART